VSRPPSLLCGTVLLLIGSGTARAAASEGGAAHRAVDLIVGAPAKEAQLLEPALREMLAAKGVEVATTRKTAVTAQDVAAAIAPPKEASPPVARALLDFTVPGEATLFLIDPRRGRVHVRRMALAHGLDAVARASVRLIVEQSIDAILEGREIGVTREEFQRSVAPPPAPAPIAPAAAPPPSDAHLQLAGGYEGVALGSGEYQHNAKIVFAARFTRVQLAAAARFGAPVSITGDGVQARLSSGGVSVSGAARFPSFERFQVSAGVGAGLDVTRVEPTVTTPDLQPAAAFWASGPSLLAFAQIERVFGGLSVAIAGGAEVHLLAERYTVRTATDTRDIFVPRRVRPAGALMVGVLF
jgi:hypothetical protein